MQKKAVNAVVQCTNDPLSLAVLRRSVWARETELDTVSSEIRAQSMIIKLFAVVSLQSE
jgi:hypothetical protein